MGWLGWPPESTMGADVNAIEMALAGRRELLQVIFGESKKSPPTKRPMTARSFRDMAKRHNANWVKAAGNG